MNDIPDPVLPITVELEHLNSHYTTPAELNLKKAVLALEDVMSPMPGVVNQHIGFMMTSDARARTLTRMVKEMSEAKKSPLKICDIGTAFGRSAGAMARGMINGGEVITIDLPRAMPDGEKDARFERFQTIAKSYANEELDLYGNPIKDKLSFVTGDAHNVMNDLLKQHGEKSFDVVYIDAEKSGYPDYWEKAKKLVKAGGKIMVDNVVWSTRVANPLTRETDARALRQFNHMVSTDLTVEAVITDGIDDGLLTATILDEREIAQRKTYQHLWGNGNISPLPKGPQTWQKGNSGRFL